MSTKRRITTNDAERLVSGDNVVPELESLVSFVAALSEAGSADPGFLTYPSLDRIAVQAAATASAITAADEVPVSVETAGRRRLSRLRGRAAAAAGIVAVVLGSGTGAAIAADGAAPGDLLYGLDRALEAVGIGNGGAAERLEEVEDLVTGGDIAAGLEHVPKVVEADATNASGDIGDTAREALQAAADRIRATQASATGSTAPAVADLLTYLSDNIGQVDGARVTELSLLIDGSGQVGRGQDTLGVPGSTANPATPSPPNHPVESDSGGAAPARPETPATPPPGVPAEPTPPKGAKP